MCRWVQSELIVVLCVLEYPLGCSNLSHQVRSGVAAQCESGSLALPLDGLSSACSNLCVGENLGHGHREST